MVRHIKYYNLTPHVHARIHFMETYNQSREEVGFPVKFQRFITTY